MAVYTVQVTLNVDEEKISEAIAKDAYNKVINNIQNQVENILFKKRNYDNKTEISKIAAEVISKEFETEKEIIVNNAIKDLSNRLIRSKLVKEKVGDMIMNINNE